MENNSYFEKWMIGSDTLTRVVTEDRLYLYKQPNQTISVIILKRFDLVMQQQYKNSIQDHQADPSAQQPSLPLQKSARQPFVRSTNMSEVFLRIEDQFENHSFIGQIGLYSSSEEYHLDFEENDLENDICQVEEQDIESSNPFNSHPRHLSKSEIFQDAFDCPPVEYQHSKQESCYNLEPQPSTVQQKNKLNISLQGLFVQEPVEREKNMIKNIFRLFKKEIQKIKKNRKRNLIANSPFFKQFEQEIKVLTEKRFNLLTLKRLLVEGVSGQKQGKLRRLLCRRILSQNLRRNTFGSNHKMDKERYLVNQKTYVLRFMNTALLQHQKLK